MLFFLFVLTPPPQWKKNGVSLTILSISIEWLPLFLSFHFRLLCQLFPRMFTWWRNMWIKQRLKWDPWVELKKWLLHLSVRLVRTISLYVFFYVKSRNSQNVCVCISRGEYLCTAALMRQVHQSWWGLSGIVALVTYVTRCWPHLTLWKFCNIKTN